MGRIVTPTYRVVIYDVALATRNTGSFAASWRCRGRFADGSPTDANLKRYVRDYESSTLPEGVNAHLGVRRVTSAKIVHQASGRCVASYDASREPAFEVIA